jgi:hypothetical protein
MWPNYQEGPNCEGSQALLVDPVAEESKRPKT